MKRLPLIECFIGIGMLLYAVWFNLDLYKLEPTALTDPNDNTFQYGLVDRTHQMWEYALEKCTPIPVARAWCVTGYLIDHWVPNWAQGYNLPFYYSHVPQITIVGFYKLFTSFGVLGSMSLFQFYHWTIYLLLCLFPVAMFASLRIIGMPWIIAGSAALLSTHISTDGLYGIDPPSFLWRGYGLSSQLFAMLFIPLGLAYAYRFFAFRPHTTLTSSLGHEIIEQVMAILPFLKGKRPDHGKKKQGAPLPQTGQARTFWLSVVFLVATVLGHLGMGMITLISLLVFVVARPIAMMLDHHPIADILTYLRTNIIRIALLGTVVVFFVSYWVVPTVLGDNYHNISVWDPIWKFNSYGWKETMIRLFDGDLFDFGRFPVFTFLALAGGLGALFIRRTTNDESIMASHQDEPVLKTYHPYFPFALLFVFWLVLYFGRTTWGGIIDLIPGMKEFHLSRFIVGLHVAGLFLAPIGIYWLTDYGLSILRRLKTFFEYHKFSISVPPVATPLLGYVLTALLLWVVIPPLYKQTIYYNELNDRLIVQGNIAAAAKWESTEELFETLRSLPPARVFAGRGGWWGKDFEIAETPMYMHLSTYGIPTVLWLPQTWSPNSDTEQYFSEDQAKDYELYNIKYIVAPPAQAAQPFWKEIRRNPDWVIYEAPTTGYFTTGTRSQVVVTKKTTYYNIVRLWIQSTIPTLKLYPELTFTKPRGAQDVPVIEMLDEVTYSTQNGQIQNIFMNNPLYGGDLPAATIIGPEVVDGDMIFKTRAKVDEGCNECMIILRQTFHPNWRAFLNGKPAQIVSTFPFYIGIPVAEAGKYDVELRYEPSSLKMTLLFLEVLALGSLLTIWALPALSRLRKLKRKK